MSSIRTVSMEYGDTRISIYLIDLPQEYKTPIPDTAPVMHSHFYYELHYAARGQCKYRFPDRQILLREGEMLLIPPGTLHGAVDKHSASYQPRVLSLSLTAADASGKFYPAFLSMLGAVALQPMRVPRTLPEQIDILQRKELYDSVLGVCRLKAAAGSLIFDLFQLLSPYASGPDTPSSEPPCDAEAAVLLENLVNRPDVSLEQIAAAINYSPRHTARLIKSIYGASLSEIRRSRKNKTQ